MEPVVAPTEEVVVAVLLFLMEGAFCLSLQAAVAARIRTVVVSVSQEMHLLREVQVAITLLLPAAVDSQTMVREAAAVQAEAAGIRLVPAITGVPAGRRQAEQAE
jgi:hypothetical protein